MYVLFACIFKSSQTLNQTERNCITTNMEHNNFSAVHFIRIHIHTCLIFNETLNIIIYIKR